MYNREFIDNNLNMFNWWYIEKFNLSRLKRVYIIFITFPTASIFSCIKIEHRKKNFHFCASFFFLIPSLIIRHWYSHDFLKKIVGIGCITFSYQQHKTQNFLIISPVWERGKMILCNDWANHQNISQNWQGWSGGRERVWNLKVRT